MGTQSGSSIGVRLRPRTIPSFRLPLEPRGASTGEPLVRSTYRCIAIEANLYRSNSKKLRSVYARAAGSLIFANCHEGDPSTQKIIRRFMVFFGKKLSEGCVLACKWRSLKYVPFCSIDNDESVDPLLNKVSMDLLEQKGQPKFLRLPPRQQDVHQDS